LQSRTHCRGFVTELARSVFQYNVIPSELNIDNFEIISTITGISMNDSVVFDLLPHLKPQYYPSEIHLTKLNPYIQPTAQTNQPPALSHLPAVSKITFINNYQPSTFTKYPLNQLQELHFYGFTSDVDRDANLSDLIKIFNSGLLRNLKSFRLDSMLPMYSCSLAEWTEHCFEVIKSAINGCSLETIGFSHKHGGEMVPDSLSAKLVSWFERGVPKSLKHFDVQFPIHPSWAFRHAMALVMFLLERSRDASVCEIDLSDLRECTTSHLEFSGKFLFHVNLVPKSSMRQVMALVLQRDVITLRIIDALMPCGMFKNALTVQYWASKLRQASFVARDIAHDIFGISLGKLLYAPNLESLSISDLGLIIPDDKAEEFCLALASHEKLHTIRCTSRQILSSEFSFCKLLSESLPQNKSVIHLDLPNVIIKGEGEVDLISSLLTRKNTRYPLAGIDLLLPDPDLPSAQRVRLERLMTEHPSLVRFLRME